MTDPEKSLQGKLGAELSWFNTTDRAARTAPARDAFLKVFLDAADGDPVRAEHLRKAHFARLALKSVAARRKAREQTALADAADAELHKDLGAA